MGRIALAGFFLLLLVSSVFSDEPDKTLHEKCLYPSVMVTDGEEGIGSGVIVRSDKVGSNYRNIVLSAAHCFDNKRYFIRVATWKDWSDLDGFTDYPCKVYVIERNLDLAVVIFESKVKMPCVDIAFDEKLFIGSEVMRIGCGYGDPMRVDFGKVTSLNAGIRDNVKTLRTNIYTVPGDSGGGVFHKNKLIGIMQAIRSTEHGLGFNISFVVPVSEIKKWNATLNNNIDFVFDHKKPLPVMAFQFKEFNFARMQGTHAKQPIWSAR